MKTVVVIGCGRMGQRHIEAVMGMDDVLRLSGIVDARKAALDEACGKYVLGNNMAFSGFDALLQNHVPDLVIVATTAPSHHDYVVQAAEAGVKYILCEKPMAVSVRQCEAMIAACDKSGALLAVNHPVRFTEADIAIRDLLQSDVMGGVNAVNVSAGNFGLAMNASHNIEMLRFLTGEMPVEVQAWFDRDVVANPRGAEFEDRSGQLRITTDGGKVMTVNASVNNGHGIIVTYAAKYGQVVLNALTGAAIVTHRKSEFRDKPTTLYGLPAESYVTTFESSDLVERCRKTLRALLAGKDYPDAGTIRRTVEILAGAYMSAEQDNTVVRLGRDALPADRVFPWA